jgi:hypothetical protein
MDSWRGGTPARAGSVQLASLTQMPCDAHKALGRPQSPPPPAGRLVQSQRHFAASQCGPAGKQSLPRYSRVSAQKGAHRPLGWQSLEQHCASRTHPLPGRVQPHLRFCSQTVVQHCSLVEHASLGPLQTQLVSVPLPVHEVDDPPQHVQPRAHLKAAHGAQSVGLTSPPQPTTVAQRPPQGIVYSAQPRHLRLLRLQLPEAQCRFLLHFPPVGRRQLRSWQTASSQSAQSPSVKQVLAIPRPGQTPCPRTRTGALVTSAVTSPCSTLRREGPCDSARVSLSNREPSIGGFQSEMGSARRTTWKQIRRRHYTPVPSRCLVVSRRRRPPSTYLSCDSGPRTWCGRAMAPVEPRGQA